jgi:nicotinate-nucleotide adenylyltransferase
MTKERSLIGLPAGRAQRVGLFGGSFNPAHQGHLAVAEAARRALRLDRVILLVSPGSPLKAKEGYLPFSERLARTRALFAGRPWAFASDFESREGLSYTADTIAAIARRAGPSRLVWIMGADSLASFHLWRDWRRIAAMVPILAVSRPGQEKAALTSPAARALWRYRLPSEQAVRLPDLAPPAWCYLPAVHDETSATAIRENRDL